MSEQIPRRAAVVVEHAEKSFRRPRERASTLKERALHPLRRTPVDHLHALKDVSFAVEPGEFFGIVGRNGSGKSTLLKCLGGIYRLDSGAIYIDGRVSPFIELGVGFNPELAARDNVMLNGIMLGLSPREARRRYEQVIDFAELREYEDLKLKNYSSGMHVRLAFSVAIQVDADILLIDEVLAVGDAAFQQKCFDVFNDMRDAGRTILFVTHDMGMVTRFCHRAMLLERGELITIGEPRAVADRYLELNFHHAGETEQPAEDETPDRIEQSAQLVEAWIEDDRAVRVDTCGQGHTYTFKVQIRFRRAVQDPAFTLVFFDDQWQDVFVATTAHDVERSGRYEAGDVVTFGVTVDCVFRPGRYQPAAIVAVSGTGQDVIDRWNSALNFVVVGPEATGGVVDLPHRIGIEREAGTIEVEITP